MNIQQIKNEIKLEEQNLTEEKENKLNEQIVSYIKNQIKEKKYIFSFKEMSKEISFANNLRTESIIATINALGCSIYKVKEIYVIIENINDKSIYEIIQFKQKKMYKNTWKELLILSLLSCLVFYCSNINMFMSRFIYHINKIIPFTKIWWVCYFISVLFYIVDIILIRREMSFLKKNPNSILKL